MAGIFAPTPDTNVYVRSPTEPVKPGPSDLEIGVGLAEGFLGGVQSFMKASQTTARTKGSKVDPNLKIFSEEMDKIGQIRSSQGEMAGRLAERNVASNFAAAGIDLGAEYKTVYETKTGRSFDAYGRDDVAYLREQQLKDENIQASMVASLATLSPNASIEDRLNYAIGEKAKVQSAANLVSRAQADATVNWLEAEAGFNQITDNFLATGMGGLIQREQSGIPITAQDISQFKLNWNQLKAGPLRQPSYLKDDQWKAFGSRVTQVDNMIATLEKASSNETLSNSITRYISDAISKAEGLSETQKAVLTLGAMKGDPAILQQLIGERFGDVAKILNNAKVADLPSTKIFGSALTNPNTPPPGPNHILTKDQIPSEIQNKYDMSASERVNQLRADKTWTSLFTASNMANPENREAFAEKAMSLGTTLVTGNTDEFLSANFLKDGIASPKFLNALKGLEEQDADLGMKTKTYVRSGLFTEKTRQNANLSSVENRIQGANFNEQTGKYEIDANFFRNKQDVAAFNADLNEFYGGDLSVAARDNFNKIEAKYSGFRVSGVNATNVIRLGRLNAIPEALKRREAIKVIDQGLEQLADPTEDILAPITEPSGEPIQEPVMNQGATPTPIAQETTSGVTEPLLDTLSKIESSGDPNAVSTAGAIGLYQILPDTAADPGFNVRPLSTGSDVAAAPPEEQRRFARDYLNAMVTRYNGDIALALAAYNGGYGRVDDFVANGTALPKETFDYVQKFVTQGALPRDNSVSSGRPKLDVPADGKVNAVKGSILDDVGSFVTSIIGALVDAGIPEAQAKTAAESIPLPPVRPEEAGGAAPMSPSQRRIAQAQARQQAKAEEFEEMNSTPLTIVPAMGRAVIGDILRNQLGISQEDITRTEDYFSPEELGVIRGLVEKGLKGDKTKGSISYQDYTTKGKDVRFANDLLPEKLIDPEFSVKTTLGQFNWKIDDRGHLIVTDKYDFNDAKDLQEANPDFSDRIDNLRKYAGRSDIGTYGIIRRAAALFGSKEGKGVNFELDLGPAKNVPLPPKRGEERSLGFSQGRLDSAIESATLAGVASTVLDFVPVVGEIKGGVELIEQYQEDKDPVMAGINLAALALGVIPGVGDAAGKALKGAAPKLVDEASKFVDDFLEGKLTIPRISNERPPNKTVTAYRIFRKNKNDDNLYPLFVNADTPIPQGTWVKAAEGAQGKSVGTVKSKLGDLAYRPGFHAGDTARSTHIGGKLKGETKPSWRPANQVWTEVEMADDFDWQTIAKSNASIVKSGKNKGKLNVKEAQITDQIPFGGHYKYKTNPNMEGEWLISGDMKVNRVLNPNEVKKAGDLPTLPELIKQRNLTPDDLPRSAIKELQDYYPEVYQELLSK